MSYEVIQGDALAVLRGLESGSVSACVTSPPYLGLRSYGTSPQAWGGDASHDHVWDAVWTPNNNAGGGVTRKQETNTGSYQRQGGPLPRKTDGPRGHETAFCACGAWRGELGLEPTPDLYVEHMVSVFREVRRVLHDSGTLWLNVGDSYSALSTHAGGDKAGIHGHGEHCARVLRGGGHKTYDGCKPKDLLGIPWLLAFALRADGWWLRSEITLTKAAPMPESVAGSRWERHKRVVKSQKPAAEAGLYAAGSGNQTMRPGSGGVTGKMPEEYQTLWEPCPGCPKCSSTDGLVLRMNAWRPTRATESLFLFAKGESYYADQEAVRRSVHPSTVARNAYPRIRSGIGAFAAGVYHSNGDMPSHDEPMLPSPAGGNAWDWMPWKNEPSSEAHYAAFGAWLPSWCIQAGTSARGCCVECGGPYVRVIEREALGVRDDTGRTHSLPEQRGGKHPPPERGWESTRETLGWRASCRCEAGEPVPSRVLDPFAGTGTTGIAALKLGRDFVGIELSEEYCSIARRRLSRAAAQGLLSLD